MAVLEPMEVFLWRGSRCGRGRRRTQAALPEQLEAIRCVLCCCAALYLQRASAAWVVPDATRLGYWPAHAVASSQGTLQRPVCLSPAW